MIVSAVPLPACLGCSATMDSGAPDAVLCEHVVSLLEDLAEIGQLVIDVDRKLLTDFEALMEDWSPSQQDRAAQHLRRMQERGRVVPGRITAGLSALGPPDCRDVAASLTRSETPDFILAPYGCDLTVAAQSGIVVLPNTVYTSLRGLFTNKAYETGFTLFDGEWQKSEFTDRIWRRIFPHATNLILIDRQIGISLIRELDRAGSRTRIGTVISNYAQGIQWIAEEFSRLARKPGELPVRLFTEAVAPYMKQLTPALLKDAEWALDNFSQRVASLSRVRLESQLLISKPSFRFPHQRYLFTNQISLSIDRGADLLRHDGRVRDVAVYPTPSEDKRKVMNTVRSLQNVQ
jgi:hypothetical protein